MKYSNAEKDKVREIAKEYLYQKILREGFCDIRDLQGYLEICEDLNRLGFISLQKEKEIEVEEVIEDDFYDPNKETMVALKKVTKLILEATNCYDLVGED